MSDLDADSLGAYLASIRHIPVLSHEETCARARAMAGHERALRGALCARPEVAEAVLERWRDRREAGRVTAVLAADHRDGGAAKVGERLDRALRTAERRLARGQSAAAALARADLALDVLLDVQAELAAQGVRFADADAALDAWQEERRALTRHNLKLVVTIAKRYRNLGIPFTDLIQEGNLGLIRAVEKFDPERGFRFSSYAVWWITQALIRVIQNHSRTVRVPSHLYELRYRRRPAEQRLHQRLGRAPSEEELATELGVKPDALRHAAEAAAPVASIHAPFAGAEEVGLEDRLPDDQVEDPTLAVDRERSSVGIARELAGLDARERRIVCWRYGLDGGEPLTLAQIGERMGLSRERVRQLESRALGRLRDRPGIQRLVA